MQTSTIERQVQERLARLEARFTPGRRSVVSELARADGPLSAAELHESLEGVPLSSIYRTLAVLEEAGILAPHHARGITRYELADWLGGHHHHLVCGRCGLVEDVVLDPSLERSLVGLVGRVASEVGFDPDDHTLEIEGVCGQCR